MNIVKLTHQGSAPDPGRCLSFTTALFASRVHHFSEIIAEDCHLVWIKVSILQRHLYLHLGPGHPPPTERGLSLESIYRVSLTVDLCEG